MKNKFPRAARCIAPWMLTVVSLASGALGVFGAEKSGIPAYLYNIQKAHAKVDWDYHNYIGWAGNEIGAYTLRGLTDGLLFFIGAGIPYITGASAIKKWDDRNWYRTDRK